MDAIKAAKLCDDCKVILKSFEYCEENTVGTYYNALRNNMKDITEEQQIMINAQHTLIKEDYNNIKAMRDALAYKQVKRNHQFYY
jgi:hypothetical protein